MSRRCLLVVIAVDEHRDARMTPLPGAIKDANRLLDTLHNLSYQKLVKFAWLADAKVTRRNILKAFSGLQAEAEESDQVIIYIALHGTREPVEGGQHRYYLLPWDATVATAATHGISSEELDEALQGLRAREAVLILDCCHAGGLADVRLSNMQEEMQEGHKRWLIIAAARAHEHVVEDDGGGRFMRPFCEGLAGEAALPDGSGLVYAQSAVVYAANLANREAERLGESQVVLIGGYAPPIALTRVDDGGSSPLRRNVSIYPGPQDKRFLEDLKSQILRSKRILMVGTGLNVLWEHNIDQLLIAHARKTGARIDIVLGNPYSPQVQARLREEKMFGQCAVIGDQGIERLSKDYSEKIEQLGRSRSIHLWFFENYPTMAILRCDDRVFKYSYSYRVLGTHSPVTAMPNDGRDDVQFYVDHAERVLGEAVPADEVHRAHADPGYVSKDWICAAIYAVPAAGSPVYELGSGVLGYDIRARRAVSPDRCPVPGARRFVGEAQEFGLHVTIGDALYFANEAALERVKAELASLAAQFHPFVLTDLALAHPLLGSSAAVGLRCKDSSGVLEALHHEAVSRIYRLAISSRYRAGRSTRMPPASARAALMMGLYGAPYIFSAFDPHLTLLSGHDSTEDEGSQVLEGLRDAVARLPTKPVRIEELCLVVQRGRAKRFTIETRFLLQPESSPAFKVGMGVAPTLSAAPSPPSPPRATVPRAPAPLKAPRRGSRPRAPRPTTAPGL